MDQGQWLASLGIAAATAFSPGPALALALANASARGRRRAAWGSLGNSAGVLMLGIACLAGLELLLRDAPLLALGLRLAGACYLAYLGLNCWRAAPPSPPSAAGPQPGQRGSLLLQGFALALGNPKSLLLFSALLPPFTASGAQLEAYALILAFATLTGFSHLCYLTLLPTGQAQAPRAMLLRRLLGSLMLMTGLWSLGQELGV